MTKHPTINPTEHPRPHVDVPMSIFGDPLFSSRYELVGRFVHMWCYAVWKKDPEYRPWPDDKPHVEAMITLGWVIRRRKKLFLTGPNKDPKWLVGIPKQWRTYAIESVGEHFVKIGKALDVEQRLEQLQIGSSRELRIVGTRDGDCEARVHYELRGIGMHVRGEWFRFTEATLLILDKAGLLYAPESK